MEYKVEDGRHFMLECPAYQEIRASFQESFDDCESECEKAYVSSK